MSNTFKKSKLAAIPLCGLLVLGGATVPTIANASTPRALSISGDAPLTEVVPDEVYENLPADVQDALVVSVEADAAEDVITGVTAEGEPVEIVVQREPDGDYRPASDERLPDLDPSAHTVEAPGPQNGIIKTQPIPDGVEWKLSAVTVIEIDAVTLYWPTVETFDVSLADPETPDKTLTTSSTHAEIASKTVRLEDLEPGGDYVMTASSPDTNEVRNINVNTFEEGAAAEDRLLQPLAYQAFYQSYIHKTFIPPNRISVGNRCPDQSNGFTFGGDNRGFRTPSLTEPNATPDYRTMMFVHINWDNPAPYDLLWSKNVGQTRLYNPSGSLNNSAYTSMDGMLFRWGYATNSYAEMNLHHEANDPLCTVFFGTVNHAPPIYYDEWVTFYRSGSTKVKGVRQPAPAHEMYAKFTTATGSSEYWRTMTQRPNQGFDCLLVVMCAADGYDITTSS